MYFSSDNWSGAHPHIAEALQRHASGYAAAYGTDALDRRVEQRFSEIFEREVAVFPVANGTAANALSLASVRRPGGVVFCHREAHLIEDEGGATELLAGGSRLVPVDGGDGKMHPEHLQREIGRFPPDFVHAGQPMAVSITQATEIGTVHTVDEIRAVSEICRAHGLPLHMDGARFANALVHLDASPAEMTWRSGVDLLSFGATKNGCWCAEAVVVFEPEKARDLPFIRKQAAHLLSKMRFVSAQFEAYFDNDLWLDIARGSNRLAAQLQDGVEASSHARPAWRTDGNAVFAIMSRSRAEAMLAAGAHFHEWKVPHGRGGLLQEDEVLIRLVTSFATTPDDVAAFLDLLG